MPEIMNVTNPVPGYDNAAGNRSIPITTNDPNVQNIPDPSRVTRPDANTGEHQTATSGEHLPSQVRFDSNFQDFLQRVRDSETPSRELARILSGARAIVSSGLRAGSAEDLALVARMLQMSEAEFLQFLKDQFASGTRFGGALFDLLRDAYRQADSQGVRNDILQFLKQYSDWSSTAHIEGNLLRNLTRIAAYMPRSWGGKVADLAGLLKNGIAAGDRAGNLKLLQGQILPYLSEYVSRTHDMGKARSILTLLTLDIARYENGSEDGLLQAFHQLLNHGPLRDSLNGLSDQGLLRLLQDSTFARASQNDLFADRLAAAAGQALRGGTSADAQDAFRSLVSSLLVNESVYMNVNHYLIPLEWKGRMMFSEMWVDPDAERDDRQPEQDGGRTLRLLLKADIQSLGLFDIVLTCRNDSVDLRVRCPEKVAPFSAVIREALSGILRDNGLEAGSVQVEKLDRPLTVSEIFPKIFEGMDSINVKV